MKYSFLENLTNSTDDFIDLFIENIQSLKLHDFITKQQSSYFYYLKELIKNNKIIVSGDFSENYFLRVQDSVQTNHALVENPYNNPSLDCLLKRQNVRKSESFAVISGFESVCNCTCVCSTYL